MSLPTRKRSHSKHLDGGLPPAQDNKSRRASPSPFMTEPTTPSASSGDEEFEKFDNIFFKQQRAQEDRMKQEKLDEELARRLQEGGPANPFPVARPSAPSAFDRLSGMRPPQPCSASSSSAQHNRTSFSRTLPWATNSASAVKSEPRSMVSSVKREKPSDSYGMVPYSNSSNMNAFKTEASSSRTMPGAFGDDSSTASDSDIEIIPPESFYDNGRHVPVPNGLRPSSSENVYGSLGQKSRMQRPSFSPGAQTAREAALRRVDQASTKNTLQIAMFSSQPEPNCMQNTLPMLNSSQLNLPGPHAHPGIGMANKTAYGRPQAYGGVEGLVYGRNLFGMGGMYQGFAGGNIQNAGPFLGRSLNSAAGGVFGAGYSDNPINIDDDVPSPFQGVGARDPTADIFNRPSNTTMGEQFDYIMNDPRKTDAEIKSLLENIRPDIDLPPENREGTPEGLVYPLYEHQKLALTWMKSMEEGTNKGGILADDMGLGKTISTLALMLSRPSMERSCKTTLIVGPVALVKQWEREIVTKVKATHRMSVRMIHGQGKKKLSWDDLRVYDVVLTTYGTLGAEYKRLEVWLNQQRLAGHAHDYDAREMKKLFPVLGDNSVFYRVILDEAQNIKNKNTNASRAAKIIRSKTRFCLTGTPMMNNVGELYSLIHFLRIKPYNEWTNFQDAFGKLTKGDATRKEVHNAMKKLQAVLKAILLRRVKTSLIDGKPIIDLPPKTEKIQHVTFNEDEQAFYNALENKTQIQFNKYLRANSVGKNYSNVLVLLLRLRQACCHPHLIMDFEEAPPAGVDLSSATMIELAKTLAPDVIKRLKEADGFECPVCYDGVENPSIVIPCGHDTCAECLGKISEEAIRQNQAEDGEPGGPVKCPTCRGKIDLKRIIDYLTFKKVYLPEEAGDDGVNMDGDDSETESETDLHSDSDTESESEAEEDADYRGNLRAFVVPDDVEEIETENDADDGDDEAEYGLKRKCKSKTKKDKHRKSKGKGKTKQVKQHVSLSMLKKEASKTAAGRRKYMKYLRKNWQPSAKVDKCVELLEKFQNDGQKTIIFSQFVALLDLLQVPITEKGWKCERYDGAMSANARHDAVNKFTDKPDVKIMLISLKAGNAGLNLVAASRVIILDPFWNPFIEMQAVDRAHRIGQQNAVQVHRILIEKTVEDRIIELQEQKRKLVNSALDEGASKSLGRLTVGQLSYLFGVGGSAN